MSCRYVTESLIVTCLLMLDVEVNNERRVIRTVWWGSVKLKPFGNRGARLTVFQAYFFCSQVLMAEVTSFMVQTCRTV